MEEIEYVTRGKILNIYEIVNESNINLTQKAYVWTEHCQTVSVFCKLLDTPRQIFIECLCALIGRAIGIPIPKPYLILATPETFTGISKPTFLFGSADVEYPSLMRRLNCHNNIVNEISLELESMDKQCGVALFDEWIANPDRHEGNILFDGSTTFYFIDHETAIPTGFTPNERIGRNRLARLLYQTKSDQEKFDYLNECVDTHSPKCVQFPIDKLITHTFAEYYLDTEEINSIVHFLKNRVAYIADLFRQQLDIKQQPLIEYAH